MPARIASRRPPALALLLAAACALAPHAHADDDKRLAQAREALRRAQQSLQSIQAQRDALAQDKARLEQQKLAGDQALADAATKEKEAASQRARLDAGASALRTERDALKAELERERATARQRLEETQGRLVGAEARAEDQRRTTVALRGLLQRSVQALGENERQNRVLYDLGRQATSAYADCQMHGSESADANLLGIADVHVTDVSEQLRREMDAVAIPATLSRPAAAGGTGAAR
jgi:septal ring factor EnvC (AmiA/AmiB activator)